MQYGARNGGMVYRQQTKWWKRYRQKMEWWGMIQEAGEVKGYRQKDECCVEKDTGSMNRGEKETDNGGMMERGTGSRRNGERDTENMRNGGKG